MRTALCPDPTVFQSSCVLTLLLQDQTAQGYGFSVQREVGLHVMSNPRRPGSKLRWLASEASHSHVRSQVSEQGEQRLLNLGSSVSVGRR